MHQTRPGAAKRTGVARALVDKYVQVQHKSTRTDAAQTVVDRHFQVQHKLLYCRPDAFRYSTGASQAAVEQALDRTAQVAQAHYRIDASRGSTDDYITDQSCSNTGCCTTDT